MERTSNTVRLSRRTALFLLSIFVTAGIIAGSVYQAMNVPKPSALIHQYWAPVYPEMSIFRYMCGGLVQSVLCLTVLYLFGFFALGQPFGAAVLFYRGFGIGASAAMLYSMFGAKAFLIVLLLVVPKGAAQVIVLLLGVRELCRGSGYTLACWTDTERIDPKQGNFRLYCIKFIVLMIISITISAADAALNLVFAGLS